MYQATELATAMRHNLPVVAVVFDDGAFGNVRRIQQERFGNRLIASDLANPDFVRFAESFGVRAWRASTPAALETALARGVRHGCAGADPRAGGRDAESVGHDPAAARARLGRRRAARSAVDSGPELAPADPAATLPRSIGTLVPSAPGARNPVPENAHDRSLDLADAERPQGAHRARGTRAALQGDPDQHRQGRPVQAGIPGDHAEPPHPRDRRSRRAGRQAADAVRVRRDPDLPVGEDRRQADPQGPDRALHLPAMD